MGTEGSPAERGEGGPCELHRGNQGPGRRAPSEPELKDELGIPQQKNALLMVVEMKRASNAKKKSDNQAYANQKLGINVMGNEFSQILQKEYARKIYMITAPTAMDPVGFGLHAALTYEEVRQTQPSCIDWVKKTASEGQREHA